MAADQGISWDDVSDEDAAPRTARPPMPAAADRASQPDSESSYDMVPHRRAADDSDDDWE